MLKPAYDVSVRLRAYDVWCELAQRTDLTKALSLAVAERMAADGVAVNPKTIKSWAKRGHWPPGLSNPKVAPLPADLTPLQKQVFQRVRETAGIDLRDLKTVNRAIEGLTTLCLTVIGKADMALRAAQPATVSEASDLVRASAVLTQAAIELRMKVLGQSADLARPIMEAAEAGAGARVIEGSAISEAPTLSQKLAMFNKSRRGTPQH